MKFEEYTFRNKDVRINNNISKENFKLKREVIVKIVVLELRICMKIIPYGYEIKSYSKNIILHRTLIWNLDADADDSSSYTSHQTNYNNRRSWLWSTDLYLKVLYLYLFVSIIISNNTAREFSKNAEKSRYTHLPFHSGTHYCGPTLNFSL